MSSKAITQPPESRSGGDWQRREEAAPSLVRSDDPDLARIVGMIGAASVIFGGMALALVGAGRVTPLSQGWSSLLLAVGIAGLLFHAAFDWDIQFRRIYMVFAYLLIVILGPFLALVPYNSKMGSLFGYAFPCMLLGLLFLLAFLRNETDAGMRKIVDNVLGVLGGIMAVVGLLGGNIKGEFFTPIGLLLAALGLIYLTAYVSGIGTGDERGYRVGLAIGGVGAIVFLVALGRSALPPLFHRWHWRDSIPAEYLVPYGILLMALGALYVCVSLLLCSDRPLVVLTRRELGSLFYSPIAYIVLFVFVVAHWWAYGMVLVGMLNSKASMPEPIVSSFILQWSAVISTIFVVPVLTMRLLSEEKRGHSGSAVDRARR